MFVSRSSLDGMRMCASVRATCMRACVCVCVCACTRVCTGIVRRNELTCGHANVTVVDTN